VLLAVTTNGGEQKTLHIVMACKPVVFIVIYIEAGHAVERNEAIEEKKK
jgi:hypothetical protein